jgi:hypothetical protein
MFFEEQLYGFDFFQLKGKITSFPSGHASTIVALMLSLYFINPKYRVIYFWLSVLMWPQLPPCVLNNFWTRVGFRFKNRKTL